MNNIEKFTLLGWVCLIYSLIANFQLTLAIIFALIIMFITFSVLTDNNNDDIEDALETMNTSLDEMEDVVSYIFVGATGFIICVVVFYNFLMAI